MKRFKAILIILVLSIFVIVTMIFSMKYNNENTINEKLLNIPRYDWREYIDYLKTVIDVPLNDKVQLFGFSNKVNVELCLSIKTALLSGFQYQLVGPDVIDNISKKLTHSIFSRCLVKWIVVSAIIEKLPENIFIIVADTFDVTYQMDPNNFYEKYKQFLNDNKDYEDKIIFNSELNCWPYRYDNNYRCLKHSGEHFYNLYAENSLRFFKQDNIKKENPIGCQIQEKISKERKLPSNKYLNAGVSLGLVSNYRNLMLPFWNEISNSPLGCIDDQGVMGWLYGTKQANISLDYEGKLVEHVLYQNFDFDEKEGIFRNSLTTDDKKYNYPLLVHHSGDKRKYVYMVRSFSKWRETNKHQIIDNNSTFYINGIEKKYLDVCGKFTEKDVEALDTKHNKSKH